MKKTLLAILLFTGIPHLLGQEILLRWSFDDVTGARAQESISGISDPIRGYFEARPSVRSGAIQFDGFTSYLYREKS